MTKVRLSLVYVLLGAADCGGGGVSSRPVDLDGGGAGEGGAGGAGGAAGADGGAMPPAALVPDLAEPAATVGGGSVDAPAGTATNGGTLSITSGGGLVLDPAVLATPPAPTPPVPAGGSSMVSQALASDVTRDETIRIAGSTVGAGADAVRTITSSAGDIVIEGELRGADLGAATQGLALHAPAGTVYIVGTVDTRGADRTRGDGGLGGDVTIKARDIVVVGTVTSAGGDGATSAGHGGAITLTADQAILVPGAIDSFGGDARSDGPVSGGAAGDVHLSAGGDVLVTRVRLHGGGGLSKQADAAGGAGATLTLDADGALRVADSLDARGGPARAAGTGIAGLAGNILIGQHAPPSRIEMGVPLLAVGGSGPDAGGAGGPVTLQAAGGDLVSVATIDFGGGSSRAHPGDAGSIHASAGPRSGGFTITGKIVGNGGSAEPGGSANGGLGGLLRLAITSLKGDFTIDPSGEVRVDGGASSGGGTAGGGGDMDIRTVDGNMSMGGRLVARGGDAPDPGGVGGEGGILNVWTDTNHDGIGGNLIVETSGVIDVSGGSGTTGGSGRNNGGIGVALFPIHQEQLSVLLDSETIKGNSHDGIVDNKGLIISRGGAVGGAGGDVMFHGRQPNGADKSLPGLIWQEGDSGAPSGGFAGE